MTKVYSYIVANDAGFAPNPFHGICTLACCKPDIRRAARPGDIVVGMSKRAESIVYAMAVERVLTFDAYWEEGACAAKRPDMSSARIVDRCGDNIYQPTAIGAFRQLHSLHSRPNGDEKLSEKNRDLGGLHALLSRTFAYFGEGGPPLPPDLSFLKVGRGHRCRFTPEQIARVTTWFAKLPSGVRGRPAKWRDGDTSWQQS